MKIFIHVTHSITIDPQTQEFLKNLFPNSGKLVDLTEEIKNKTSGLKDIVEQNQPQT